MRTIVQFLENLKIGIMERWYVDFKKKSVPLHNIEGGIRFVNYTQCVFTGTDFQKNTNYHPLLNSLYCFQNHYPTCY